MKEDTYYEWDVEEEDENGDVVGHCFHETAAEAVKGWQGEATHSFIGQSFRLVLVYNMVNEEDGVFDRAWAYMRGDATLPEFFELPDVNGVYRPTGHRVPKRFHDELRKAFGFKEVNDAGDG